MTYRDSMDRNKYAQLYEELADELFASCKTKPIDSPNYKRQSSLMQRARQAAAEIEGREVPTLELVLKPIGDCWLQIKAPSGRQAAINLGPRGSFTDQTFIGSVILEVAELSQHRRQPLRVGGGEELA